MDIKKEYKELDKIAQIIKLAGYNAYDQLFGYSTTGNLNYITRKDDARDRIKDIDIFTVKKYVIENKFELLR